MNNDGATVFDDLGEVLDAVQILSTGPVYDFDRNGIADLVDLMKTLDDSALIAAPGPSGYPCASTIPCPTP